MIHSLYKTSALLIIIMLFGCGCWDRRETEELLLVDAIVFDLAGDESEEKYQVSFITTKPPSEGEQMGMGGGGEDTGQPAAQWIATIIGDSIEEVLRTFNTRSPRYEFFAHNRIIIIGEKLARKGFSEILDFLVRKEGIRLRNNILIDKGMVMNLLMTRPEFENTISEELNRIILIGSAQSDFFDRIDLNEFTRRVITPGLDAWSPVVDSIDASTEKTENPARTIVVDNTALFKRDKLVDFLNKEETQAFLMLNGHGKQGIIKKETDGKRITFSYNSVKVDKKFEIIEDKISVTYILTLKGIIGEINYYTEFTDEEVKKLEELFSDEVEQLLLSTILKLKKSGSDALGIGRFVHINNRSLWREIKDNWDEVYQDIDVKVEARTHIIGTDLVRNPITELIKGR